MIFNMKGCAFRAWLVLSALSVGYGFSPVSFPAPKSLALSQKSHFAPNISRENIILKQSARTDELSELQLEEENDDGFVSLFQSQYSQLTKGYSDLTKKYYLTMAAVQSGTIALIADIITQEMEGVNYIHFSHVFAIALVAATASGSFNAFWLRKIENAFPGKDPKDVFVKAMISTLLLGGAINAGYIVGIPLFSSTIFASNSHLPELNEIFKGWTNEEFFTLTKVECSMFLPYHLAAFNLVPPQIRPLTQAAMAGTFNIIVSAVTMGIFDVWIDGVLQFLHLSRPDIVLPTIIC